MKTTFCFSVNVLLLFFVQDGKSRGPVTEDSISQGLATSRWVDTAVKENNVKLAQPLLFYSWNKRGKICKFSHDGDWLINSLALAHSPDRLLPKIINTTCTSLNVRLAYTT